MTLHFHGLHAPRWLVGAHVNRALTLVLGVIGVSILLCALRVLDVAISGALVQIRPATIAAAVAAAASAPERLVDREPAGAGVRPVDVDLVEVPEATAQAVSL